MSRSIHLNDTWAESDRVHHKLIASMSEPEPEYEPPRVWPHQVPVEKRKAEVCCIICGCIAGHAAGCVHLRRSHAA